MSAELDTLRAFVDRVGRRARAADVASGAVAVAAGTFALVAGALTPAASFWSVAPALVSAAGLVVALAGACRAARALVRPPPAREVADWIERAAPELSDSLATSIEGGPLAEVSARYAAARLADAPKLAPEPRLRRRARASVLVSSGLVLVAGVLAHAFLPRPATDARTGSRGPTAEAPAPRVPGGREDAPRADPRGPSEAGRAVEVVVRAGAPRGEGRAGAGPGPAGEVLVASPEGFERAVELFCDSIGQDSIGQNSVDKNTADPRGIDPSRIDNTPRDGPPRAP